MTDNKRTVYRHTNLESTRKMIESEGRRLSASMWSELLYDLSIPEVALFNMYLLIGSRKNGNISDKNMAINLHLSVGSIRRLRNGLEKKKYVLIRTTKGKDDVQYTTLFIGKERVEQELQRLAETSEATKELENV